jgi:hypothetical protein
MVAKAMNSHSNTDCTSTIIRVPKVNGVITCVICEGKFSDRLGLLDHLRTYKAQILKENGFKWSMVNRQAKELKERKQSRKEK